MAFFAKGYQVVLVIIAKSAARTDVMNLKEFLAAAILTPPAIAFQDLTMKLFVRWHVEFETWALLVKHIYAGIFRWDEKLCLS